MGGGGTSTSSSQGFTSSGIGSWLGIIDTIAGLASGLGFNNSPSKTTQWLSLLGLGGISSIFDSPVNEPFKVFSPLALATDQLRRGIPYTDKRVQRRLANFNKRTAPGARFSRHLRAAGFQPGTTAEYLLANFDFEQAGRALTAPARPLPLGTRVSAEERRALGAPVADTPGAGTNFDARFALTPAEHRLLAKAERRARIAPNLKPVVIPDELQAKIQAAAQFVAGQSGQPTAPPPPVDVAAPVAPPPPPVAAAAPVLPVAPPPGSTVAGQGPLDPNSPAARVANARTLNRLGAAPSVVAQVLRGGNEMPGLWDSIGGVLDTVGQVANIANQSVIPALVQTGVIGGGGGNAGGGIPYNPGLLMGGNVTPGMSFSPQLGAVGAGALGSILGNQFPPIGAGLDLPGIDVVSQGAGTVVQPFRVTADGRQVAQPHLVPRANGGQEWFIPAGRPTAWSKASVKRRRCRPR